MASALAASKLFSPTNPYSLARYLFFKKKKLDKKLVYQNFKSSNLAIVNDCGSFVSSISI